MVQEIAERVEVFAARRDMDNGMPRRFAWRVEHRHAGHNFAIAVHKIKEAEPFDRLDPAGEFGIGRIAIPAPRPVFPADQMARVREPRHILTLPLDRQANIMIEVRVRRDDVRHLLRPDADTRQPGLDARCAACLLPHRRELPPPCRIGIIEPSIYQERGVTDGDMNGMEADQ